MNSILNIDSETLKQLLEDVGIEDSIRNEIIIILDGKHKKRHNIENKVFENLKKLGIFDKVFERLSLDKKSHGFGDLPDESSVPDDPQYSTSFAETSNTNGGGDGNFTPIFLENDRLTSKENCVSHSVALPTSSKHTFHDENKGFIENNGKSRSSSEDAEKSSLKKTEIVHSGNYIDSVLPNQNVKKINDDDHKKSEKGCYQQICTQKNKLPQNTEQLSRNNNITIKTSDERVFSSLSITDSKLTLGETSTEKNNSLFVKLNPKRRHLHFEIFSGKSFLDHLLEETFSMFLICLHFRGQRFWTQPTSCNSQPNFNAGFIFELHVSELGINQMADASHILSISDPIHLVLLRVLPNGDRYIASSHFFEWRYILSAEESQKTQMLDLKGVGAESSVTIGVIEIRLSLIPKLKKVLKNEDILAKINSEKRSETEKNRIFLLYSKMWWKEYLSIRSEHAHRTVKIFQRDENSIMRPVFQYVQILKVGRPLLELPKEAAWFVSLFLFESSSLLVTLPLSEQWWDPFSFLCLKKGDCENHAAFLCSLFLGFGLDAFVCIGTKEGNVPWAWVITCGRNDHTILWESTTGAFYEHNVQNNSTLHPYKTVGCVFNHKSFYANIQESDKIQFCDFNVTNRKLWKNMSEAAIASVVKSQYMSLLPGWTDPFLHSQDMETELRYLITDYRNDINLPTRWDVELCHLIAPLLTVYEMEHKLGIPIRTEELDDMLSKNVPDGFALKALPLRVTPMNNRRVFGFCLQNTIMKSIITCAETNAKLALRVHTYVYPENILSVWLIIACKYYTD